MGKLDDLLSQGNASVDDLARAGKEDGLSLDQTARKLVGAGRLHKTPVNEGSPLPEAEQERLHAMTPDERAEDTFERVFFANRPVAEAGVTGADAIAANNGRSLNTDEVEQLTDGKYRKAVDEDGNYLPGFVADTETGKRISMDVFKARRVLELAEQ